MCLRTILITLLASESFLLAQIDRSPVPFPGPSNGPFGIPGVGLPTSRDGRQGRGGQPRPQAVDSVQAAGRLEKIDDKSITLATSGAGTMDFRRTSKTRFFKDSNEVGASQFKSGDQVSVEGSRDQQGYLYAEKVYWQGGASDTTAGTKPSATSDAPAPAPSDPGDPGPPVLRRGVPPASPGTAEPVPSPAQPVAHDHYLQMAREADAEFAGQLPDYVCTEYMTRYLSNSRPANWEAQDVVSAEVVYANAGETYRNVAVNGRQTNKRIEDLQGAWSTGEFGSMLRDLFSPGTAAAFRFDRESSTSETRARVYDFDVDQAHSHWHVQVASQSVNPSYQGSVWIEPGSGRVLRIELQARALPTGFPLDTVESAVDYDRVRISNQEYLLPVHAENLACERGTSDCTHNTLDFRNYHKYEASANIEYGSPVH